MTNDRNGPAYLGTDLSAAGRERDSPAPPTTVRGADDLQGRRTRYVRVDVFRYSP